MIKFLTDKTNRFGRTVVVSGKEVKVDNKGFAEIDEDLAAIACLMGFKPVDKDAKFESMEEKEKAKKVADILDSARKQAENIIAEATKDAEKIREDARTAANIQNADIKEKEEVLAELNKLTVPQLQDQLRLSGVPETEYKGMLKEQLITLMFQKAYQK
jgi:cell division septum initiation protein DivIVA